MSTADGYLEVLRGERYPHVLCSFLYDEAGDVLDRLGYRPDHMLSDSGAFTAWQLGKTVDLDAYIAWCRAFRGRKDAPPTVHINLDVIPGRKGEVPSERDREVGMRQSVENADRMRDAGLPLMEVFHQYEAESFLHELLDRRRPGDILGISPRNDEPTSRRQQFLDWVFTVLIKRYGMEALPPCHGLGIGGRQLVFRYPWWSCDSGSWFHTPGRFGGTLDRAGVTQKKWGTIPGGPQRTPAMRYHQCAEILRFWGRWEPTLTNLWAKRGVAWQT